MVTPAPETETAPLTGFPPLTLTLFGPMRVLMAGQSLPPLHSRKSLWLLALLALRHGRAVEREWLAGTLWPDTDQDQAFANLRPVLSDLRRALGEERTRLLSPSRHALSLNLLGADCDVLAFDAAITSGARTALAQAVALYTGPLLESCAEEWAPQERRSREEDCLRALQTLADTALAEGDHNTSAQYFRRAVDMDPWRDAARRGLMEALARGGDVNAALQVYREFIALLRSDPKSAPDKETSALYARLRAGAKQQAAEPQGGPTTDPVPSVSVNGYLPHPLTDLVGREDERLEVAAKLRRSRLVTLTGPGGIGKTRLAIEVAAEAAPEFAGGVWLVALEALSDGGQVAAQIALVLGLKEEPGRSPLETVTERLRRVRALLVLDNCEQVLIGCTQVAMHLLQECAQVRLLATSREALGVIGETAWAVPTLTVPDPAHLPTNRATLVRVLAGYEGVQLFVERAQAVQKTFLLTGENAAAVAQICARLEGMPLAIELAAARIKALTVAEIALRLDDHLNLLTGSSRAGPSRQQALRATLDWSYSLLAETERLLLGHLSVFAGGWSLEGVASVCASDRIKTSQVLDLLMGLVDKSLVAFEERDGWGRYRLLETVQQYAAEKLAANGAAKQVNASHRDYFLALAEEAAPMLTGPEQVAWLRRLDLEHSNLRAALEWCAADGEETGAGLRMANALQPFWYRRSHFSEGRHFLARAVEQSGGRADVAARAKALAGAGDLAQRQRDHVAARVLHGESLRLYQEAGDRGGIAKVLGCLAVTASGQADYPRARALYEESLSILRDLGDQRGIAHLLGNLGNLTRAQGDTVSARPFYEQSLYLYRELGDKSRILWMLRCLGSASYTLGDYLTARALAEEGLAIAREDGEKYAVAESLIALGSLALEQGDPTAAQSYFAESLSLARAVSDPRMIAWSLLSLGLSACAQDDPAAGQGLCEQGLSLLREIGERRGEGWALCYLAGAVKAQGEFASARSRYQESIAIFQAIGDQGGLWRGMNDLASAVLSQGEARRAVHLWGASEALRESIGEPIPPIEQPEHNRRVAQARAILGEDIFTAVWGEGRVLTWEQAAAYALEKAVL